MKIFSMSLLLGAFLLSACTTVSPTQRRIEMNPAWYEALSQDDQLLVQQGRIREGMGKNAVFLAWGSPDSVARGAEGGKQRETWFFESYEPYRTTRFAGSYGFGYGRYGPYGGGPYGYYGPSIVYDVDYVRVPVAQVTFVGDRVVSYEARYP